MNAAVQAPEVKLFGIAATPAAKQSPRHGEVEALLTEAGQFASSMMTKIRTAAKIASETFVADAGVKDNVENAMAEYAKVLRDIDDHNVKANFNSALGARGGTSADTGECAAAAQARHRARREVGPGG